MHKQVMFSIKVALCYNDKENVDENKATTTNRLIQVSGTCR